MPRGSLMIRVVELETFVTELGHIIVRKFGVSESNHDHRQERGI